MREDGEDDDHGMVSDVEGVWRLSGREMSSSMRMGFAWRWWWWVVALIVAKGVGGDVDGSGRSSGVGDSCESMVYRSGAGGGRIVYRSGGGGLCRSG